MRQAARLLLIGILAAGLAGCYLGSYRQGFTEYHVFLP